MKLNSVFSSKLIEKLKKFSVKKQNMFPQLDLKNIPKEFIELVITGIAVETGKNIIIINKDNSDFYRQKFFLEKWLNLFSREFKILTYSLPFTDPYISNKLNLEFAVEKNEINKAIKTNAQTIIITSLTALDIKLETIDGKSEGLIRIKSGDKIKRDDLIIDMVDMGYIIEDYVENIGEIAKRGGVIDVFPLGSENPVRIELFGNDVSAITVFDLETRETITKIEECEILPYKNEESNTFTEYLKKKNLKHITEIVDDYILITNDIDGIIDEFKEMIKDYENLYDLTDNISLPLPREIFDLNIYNYGFINFPFAVDYIENEIEFKRVKNINEMTVSEFDTLKNRGEELFLFSKSGKISEKLKIKDENIFKNSIPFSFKNIKTSSVFLTEKDLIYKLQLSKRQSKNREDIGNTIKIDEFVVHEKHGIGIFLGFYELQIGKSKQEFFKLKYADNDILYVPTYDANVLKKYSSFQGTPQKLDKIGGKSWNIKKMRAKKSILLFAKELLNIYAMRKSVKGKSYFGDKEMEEKLKEYFPYIETPDQERAINDVYKDLEREFPMDRLVCGDVSFGKTEVAIRAAFRVVSEGKQVAVLCPTTILTDQHFITFQERLKNFPVNIGRLSRMVKAKDRKKILNDLETGKIDIIIGTHSIISKNIVFKNLGLFIIDEEQRFGVFQKERIKKNRESIDVLSLSATPIPRTLSMAFAGLADISTIMTPPPGRVSIKNYLGRYSKKIIISAILNEMRRDGSVFIVYNSIDKLYSFKEELESWIENLSVVIVHAKLKPSIIEENVRAFIDGKYRVMLSTTIIENGIDIQNVNTLIVIDADNFGLSQLYQLRGRVGRGKRQAFAYFLVKKNFLKEKAKLRLNGIREFSDVGAGFKLSEYDLKLRGAGALLGNKQHGHIEALGFDYYNYLLKRTVEELKGKSEKIWDGELFVHFDYAINSDYIEKKQERIKLYREISDAENFTEIDRIRENIIGQYGKLDYNTERIFFVGKVKLFAKKYNIERVDIYPNEIKLKFSNIDLSKIFFSNKFIDSYMPNIAGKNSVTFRFKDYNIFMETLDFELETMRQNIIET